MIGFILHINIYGILNFMKLSLVARRSVDDIFQIVLSIKSLQKLNKVGMEIKEKQYEALSFVVMIWAILATWQRHMYDVPHGKRVLRPLVAVFFR